MVQDVQKAMMQRLSFGHHGNSTKSANFTFPGSPIGQSETVSLLESGAFAKAVKEMNGAGVLQVLLNEIERVPYKMKKALGAHNDAEFVQKIVQEMNDILHHEFLRVDFHLPARDINISDWSTVNAVRRSDSGTTGTFFVQCAHVGDAEPLQVVVAKPVTFEDYRKNVFVNEIASRFFQIRCPAVRLISASDEEFSELEKSLKGLFLPLNEELYNLGGHHSPKGLFSAQAVMLLEFVKGKALAHRSKGQRMLQDTDYHILGKVFLLDLLIRNTDRLPCSKAMPRPGSQVIEDHGNAGNILFGEHPGEVWSIDPEMITHLDPATEETYGSAFESVLLEIINREHEEDRFKAINSLFFEVCPGLVGILDSSLNESRTWRRWTPEQRSAASLLLQMIRLQAHADDDYVIKRAGGVAPPEDDDEKAWREWIRLAVPRTITDVLQFLEVYTGYPIPSYAFNAFETGFLDSIVSALEFQEQLKSSRSGVLLESESTPDTSQAIEFILRMIDRTRKYCNKDVFQQKVRKFHRNRRVVKAEST